jgi:Glyoxalase-like domain
MLSAMPAVDHLILAVPDLRAAAARLTAATGLAVLPGGIHPDWGTANLIVPLGTAYLELVTVVDRAVAEGTAFGGRVAEAEAAAAGGGDAGALAGWAVAVQDVDAVAARLGVAVRRGRRAAADGTVLSWAMAGVDEALPRGLPFFLRWDDAAANPARGAAAHRIAPAGVAWIEVGGDRAELAAWLGDAHGLDLRTVAGAPPGPLRAGIAVAGGGAEIVVPLDALAAG